VSATVPDAGRLSYCAQQVRRYDNDRYLTALFAAADVRDDLFALYAFNLEIAKTREIVREPLMGRIRLQWWRDCIAEIYAGSERPHQVAQPLAAAIRRRELPRAPFDRLLDARETDMEDTPPPDLAALSAYADATSGSLGHLALQVVGAGTSEEAVHAVRPIWTAWALTGLLRAVPFHAASRRAYLPQTLMAAEGMTAQDLFEGKRRPAIAAIAQAVADEARRLLREGRASARRLPRRALPALMPATLAAMHLRRLEAADYDVFAARVQEAPPARLWRLLLVQLRGRV
jgi:NADH dehydrogenase [ubiquinone] 1 alpha subcomplex assembly factor 6